MNKIISKKEIIDTVCIVLEKEKNCDSVVFTSARAILRKSKREDFTPKDVSMALEYLENENKIEVVSKSNRQTVLRVKDNLFELNLENVDEEFKEENDINLKITPKKLFDIFESRAEDNRVEIPCKDVRIQFGCTYSQVMATLNFLAKKQRISYMFDKGMLYVNLKRNNSIVKEDLNNKDIVNFDNYDVFDDIGESLESIFSELDKLRKENGELNKKLVMVEVANKRLKEENNTLAARCESMQNRNDRLYNQLVNIKNNMN